MPIHGTLAPYMWLDDLASAGTELNQCSANSHGHTSMHLTCNLTTETLNECVTTVHRHHAKVSV